MKQLEQYVSLLEHADHLVRQNRGGHHLPAAVQLLDQARVWIAREHPTNRQRLRAICSALSRIPASPDPWALLRLERDEVRVTRVLEWLLDPEGDHGLGDHILRWLLLRDPSPAARRVGRRPEPLTASVASEVPFETGRPDLVLHVEGLLVVGEVKVDDEVHTISKAGDRPQTTVYRREVEDPAVLARLSRTLEVPLVKLQAARRRFWFIAPTGTQGPQDDHYSEIGFGSFAAALAVAGRDSGATSWALDGVLTAFLRIASRDRDGLRLLEESRIALAEPPSRPSAYTAMRTRALVEAWDGIDLETT